MVAVVGKPGGGDAAAAGAAGHGGRPPVDIRQQSPGLQKPAHPATVGALAAEPVREALPLRLGGAAADDGAAQLLQLRTRLCASPGHSLATRPGHPQVLPVR